MNKTDRMLAIILELQSKGRLRAEDLAGTFETSVRTIYRDMQALSEAGVPIIGSPGQGYSLIEGYFLPPVSFTADEAVTLLLGLEFIDQQFDEVYQVNAADARQKIEAVLNEKVKSEAERTRAGMRLITSRATSVLTEKLTSLRRAISENRQVRFAYTTSPATFEAQERTTRTVNPYGLMFRDGTWILVAYCHLRQAMRHFLLRRMEQVELLDDTFDLPQDFDLHQYSPPDERDIIVRIFIPAHLTLRIKEYDYYYIDTIDDVPDGAIATLRVRQAEDLLPWIMSWGGSGIVVLEPASLQQRVKEEAEKILKRY